MSCKAGPKTYSNVVASTHIVCSVPPCTVTTSAGSEHVVELRTTSLVAVNVEIDSPVAPGAPLHYPDAANPQRWKHPITLNGVAPRVGKQRARREPTIAKTAVKATGPGGGQNFQILTGLRVQSGGSDLWLPHLRAALTVTVP